MFIPITTFSTSEKLSINIHHIISIKGYPENCHIILVNGDKISTPEPFHSLMERVKSALGSK